MWGLNDFLVGCWQSRPWLFAAAATVAMGVAGVIINFVLDGLTKLFSRERHEVV